MNYPEIVVSETTAGVSIDDPDPSVSVLWDRAAQAAVIETSVGPTIASRAYAITHTAIFEAWAAFDPIAVGTALGDSLQVAPDLINDANKAEAMSHAAYVALADLFPEQIDIFDALMDELGYESDPKDLDPGSIAALGIRAGEAVVDAFSDDGSFQSNGYADPDEDYTPVNSGPGGIEDLEHWTPEFVPIDSGDPASLQSFLTPHWGDVRPFALESGDALLPEAPKPFFSSGVDASIDVEAGTVTIYGMSDDATWRDFRELRSFLIENDIGLTQWEKKQLYRDLMADMFDTPKAYLEPFDIDRELTLSVTKDMIGPIINEEFIAQTEAVVQASADLTLEQKRIAEFWEDGGGTAFPPGTWMSFAQFVSARDNNTLDEDAQLFFITSNAVFDAGVATWDAKEAYDYARPVRTVRELGELGLIGEEGVAYDGTEGQVIEAYAGDGLGTQKILASDFVTYQNPGADPSPPFAEYPSGHSTFSAAAAAVLELFTGSDEFGGAVEIDFLLFEEAQPEGVTTLSWSTFSEAADEAGLSRIFGGIHFEDGDLNGRALGEDIGVAVFETANTYITGTADEFAFA